MAGETVVDDLGAFLAEQRRNARMSLRQLASAAGVSNPYLSQIERGLRRPSADVLQQIARGLQISASALYQRAGLLDGERSDEPAPGTTPATTPATTFDATPAASAVVAALEADPLLDAVQRRALIDVYSAFVRDGRHARSHDQEDS